MSKCDTPDCPGHLGKFTSCQTEALYFEALDGGATYTGSDEFEGTYTLVICDRREPVDLDGRPVMVDAGNYILRTNDQGFVWLESYHSEADARTVYEAADVRYGDWLATEDEELPIWATCG